MFHFFFRLLHVQSLGRSHLKLDISHFVGMEHGLFLQLHVMYTWQRSFSSYANPIYARLIREMNWQPHVHATMCKEIFPQKHLSYRNTFPEFQLATTINTTYTLQELWSYIELHTPWWERTAWFSRNRSVDVQLLFYIILIYTYMYMYI